MGSQRSGGLSAGKENSIEVSSVADDIIIYNPRPVIIGSYVRYNEYPLQVTTCKIQITKSESTFYNVIETIIIITIQSSH